MRTESGRRRIMSIRSCNWERSIAEHVDRTRGVLSCHGRKYEETFRTVRRRLWMETLI